MVLAVGTGYCRLPKDISAHLGGAAVPPLTSPTTGLGLLDKAASSFLAPLSISPCPFRRSHLLSPWGRSEQVPSTLCVCFQSKEKPGSLAGELILPPPLPFFSFSLPFTFPQPQWPNSKNFQSDNMWAQIKPLSLGPCWHVSQTAHLPPPAL